MDSIKHPLYVYVLPLTAVMIWAINIVLTRYAVDYISPMSISFYRWFIAWLLLCPFFIWQAKQQWHVIKPNLGKLALLSLFGMVCYQGLAYSAAHYTTATNMGIVNAFMPVFSIFLSIFILSIKPSKQAWIGSALSILGLVYVIGQGEIGKIIEGEHLVGDLMMVFAVGLYAFYGVFLQKWQLKLPLGLMLYTQISFAVLFHLPLLMYFGLDALSQQNYQPVLYAALFPSLVAPFVWMIAIKRLGANRSSIFLNLAPIFTAIIAYIFLAEHWTSYHTIGGIMVIAGILLAQKK